MKTIWMPGLLLALLSGCSGVPVIPVPVSVGALAPSLLPQAPPYQNPYPAAVPILPNPTVMTAAVRPVPHSMLAIPTVSANVAEPPPLEAAQTPTIPTPLPAPAPQTALPTQQMPALQEVAQRIFQNETQGDVRKLLRWNAQEQFIDVGIGHLVWYPAQRRGRYTESFPAFLQYARSQQVPIPNWLMQNPAAGAPWADQAALERAQNEMQLIELRNFLHKTLPLQAQFMAGALKQRLPSLVQSLPSPARAKVLANYQVMENTPGGLYPVLDYLHFQGDGANPNERYQGQGWGLLQVLQSMESVPVGNTALSEFMRAANEVLVTRVANAPPERREARMLTHWENRVHTYRVPTRTASR